MDEGRPGKGKTMAMIGLVEMMTQQATRSCKPSHLAYFFCQDGVLHLSNPVSILPR
ncbi:hypothetical protein BDV12DRAFT_162187 [Aspergillus spectabilis]